MSKKLYFLISFVLVLSLSGLAQAEPIDVNNHSFEYDINGVPITELTGWDAVQGWTARDTTFGGGGMIGWQFVDDEWWGDGYEPADGNVCSFNVTADDPEDPNESCQVYQILEDANAIISENRRYTLTFSALRVVAEDAPTVYGALFYSVGGVNVAPANDVILGSKEVVLTSPPWGEDDYAGWEEITVNYTALAGAGSIGETLGVKLSVPVHFPWLDGYQVVLDNVRVDWVWATDAWDPYPADGARDVPKDVTLGWKPGVWVQSTGGHEVYFGTDETAVQDANTNWAEYQGAEDGNSWSVLNYTSGLELGRTYYWRVDEVNESYSGSNPPPPPNGRWKGPVWSFRATGYATNPSPYDGEVDVPYVGQSVSWTAGTEATSHDVYFGDDADAVADANTNSPEYKGNQAVGNTSYPLTGLAVGETYYWRIDEQSAVHPSGLKGDIWSFTVGPFLIVDNFNSYDNLEPDLWAVWDDFWVNPSDGEIALVKADVNAIRSGHSMELVFNNVTQGGSPPNKYYIGSWTDAQDMTELEIGSDWTIGGVKALTLYLLGDPCNIHSMYTGPDWGAAWPWVELEDTSSNIAFVKLDDPNDVLSASWYEWNIDLAIFDACGVTLSAIDRIAIGVGGVRTGQTKASPDPGHIYIEDIRLYPPRCRTDLEGVAYFNSLGDFSGPDGAIDCAVDYFDIEVMTDEWLRSGQWVSPSVPETDAILWYKFDEGSGATTANSGTLGSTYDGVLVNGPLWTTDAHPNDGNALDFDGDEDGDDGVYVADSPDMTGDNSVSFTAWVKREAEIPAYGGVIVMSRDEGEGSEGDNGTGVHTDKTGTNALGYTWNNWQESWDWVSGLVLPPDKWVLVALTVEPTQAIMYLAEPDDADPNIYDLSSARNAWGHDGLSEYGDDRGGWDGSPIYLGRDDPNKTDDATFPGKISDVRVYDYTLSRGNIMYLAGVSGTAYVPVDSVADLVVGIKDPNDPNQPIDDQIDFRDYAKQADNWLKTFLWPPEL